MGQLSCLDVGFGDTSVIRTSAGTVLVDCHEAITRHQDLLPGTGFINVLFVTHQHYDHFLGMESLRRAGYSIGSLVCSPYVRRWDDNSVARDEWNAFDGLVSWFQGKGTKVYKPLRQVGFDGPWWEPCGLRVWMLGPEKNIAESQTRELHDASLVFLVYMGERKCLFTGDASDTNLNWVARNTNNLCNDILHASHHGSINGADLDFIKKANPSYTVISTKAGVHSNVPHPTAINRYKTHTAHRVYRTDCDGTITWSF